MTRSPIICCDLVNAHTKSLPYTYTHITMSLRQGNNLLADLDWAPQDVPPSVKALEETCLARTNWPALIAAATRAKGQPCTILPSYRAGRTSLARLLQFEDKTHWVARVQLRESTPESSRRLRVEIDAMALLRAAGAPVPRVFVFDAGGGDGVGSAHVLMEFFQGNIALGEADKYERPRWGLIPLEHRSTCYKSMALAHVSILHLLPFALRQRTYSPPLGPLLGLTHGRSGSRRPASPKSAASPDSQTALLPPARSQASEVHSSQHRPSSRH